ncbi:hypothetical protein DPMN_025609 [Dreissena polymorpha]|uniref:Uncharacterized protein n=1 Tax=Dreissena polymorpha TaxID=45954 RepID=A0A9D4LRN1_DREPO|nr:hypothetical protein DPMN_025609 [Dreissena polymorpha]
MSRPSGRLQETPRQSTDCARQSPTPSGHLQETPIQYMTVQRQTRHQQETPSQSTTEQDSLPDCLRT